MSVEVIQSQRRALVDRMSEACLEEIGRLSYDERLPLSKKMAMLDGVVYTCLSTLPTMFMSLAKHPFAVRLFLAMIEELYSENTGLPLPHDYTRIMTARTELAKCLRRIANTIAVGKLNVYKASSKDEERVDEVGEIEARAREDLRRGSTPVVFTAENVKELARNVDSLISNALKSIDLVDAELSIEEVVDKISLLLTDKDVRKFVEAIIGEDPIDCLNRRLSVYEEAKQDNSHVSHAASWVDMVFEDYMKCVEFSVDKPPCDELTYLQDREVCARSRCALRLISLLPGILERLGVTTIASQVATK